MSQLKPRILIFIDWYLPGYKAGGPIRSCANMVAALSEYFEFYIVTRSCDYMEKTPYTHVHTDKWNVLPDGSWVYYLSAENLCKKQIEYLVTEKKYNLVYINGLYSYFFSILPLILVKKYKIKAIVAPRGMLASGALSIKPVRKMLFLSYARMRGLYRNIRFHATGQQEKEQLKKKISESAVIMVAPNLPKPVPETIPVKRIKEKGKLKILQVARIAPEKNLLFALRVLADIKGEITFNIYGPVYDVNYWNKCRKQIALLPQNVQVEYHGSISPVDMDMVFQNNQLMLMPTLGENYGHIITESLAAACPVLISDKTPWVDLQSWHAGWAIPLHDTNSYHDVLHQCVELDQESYDALSLSSWKYAVKTFDDKEIKTQYIRLFSNL